MSVSPRLIAAYVAMRLQNHHLKDYDFADMVRHAYTDFPMLVEELLDKLPHHNITNLNELELSLHQRLIAQKYLCDCYSQHDFRNTQNTACATLQQDEWYIFPSAAISIHGRRFLTYDNNIVLQNGSLINLPAAIVAIEKYLQTNRHVSELQFISSNQYLCDASQDDKELMSSPVCLDIDYLTGLLIKEELPAFKAILEVHGQDACWPINPDWFDDKRLKKAAYRSIDIMSKIIGALQHLLDGATSVETPMLFCSLGGIGSGKSKMNDIIAQATNHNYITCSVDDMRMLSSVYHLLIAANHHDDDYAIMREYAYAAFTYVNAEIKKRRLNFFRDSSGIPHEGRNQKAVQEFVRSGFSTHCLVAVATMHGDYLPESLVHNRIVKRFLEKKRAVPWPISLTKHQQQPLAQTASILDENFQHVILYDCMDDKHQQHIIAFTADIDITDNIEQIKWQNFLPEYHAHYVINDIEGMITHELSHKKKRVLVILDEKKLIACLEKALYNLEATSPQEVMMHQYPWYHL